MLQLGWALLLVFAGVANGTTRRKAQATPPVVQDEDRVVIRVFPRMPDGSDQYRSFDVACKVGMLIDREGYPYDVHIEGCPPQFRDWAREAAWDWIFQPKMVGDETVLSAYQTEFFFRRFAASTPFEEVVVAPGVSAPMNASTEGVPVVPFSDVVVKRRSRPEYPEAMNRFYDNDGLVKVSCRVRVYADKSGSTVRVDPDGCPEMMFEPVYRSIIGWRFEPVEIAGQPADVQFVIRETMRPYE